MHITYPIIIYYIPHEIIMISPIMGCLFYPVGGYTHISLSNPCIIKLLLYLPQKPGCTDQIDPLSMMVVSH